MSRAPPLGLRAAPHDRCGRGASIEGVAEWLERGGLAEDEVIIEWMLAGLEEDRAIRDGNHGSASNDQDGAPIWFSYPCCHREGLGSRTIVPRFSEAVQSRIALAERK